MITRPARSSLFTVAAAAAVAVVVGAGAGGCNGCSSTTDFCIESAKASCRVQFGCCTAVERSALFGSTITALGPYSNEGACVEVFARFCEAASQAQDEAIAGGRLAFDNAKAGECLEVRRKAAAECDANAIFNAEESCDGLITGLVADGDLCTDDDECAEPGSTCDVEPDDGSDGTFTFTLNGICKGFGDEGEPCLPGNECNGELRCILDQQTFESSCLPPQAAGARCSIDEDCQDGLRCADDGTGSGLRECTAPGGEGAPCQQVEDCVDGLQCEFNRDFILVCTVVGGANAPCDSDEDCLGGLLCADDIPPGFFTVCQPPAGQAEPCPQGNTQCLPGLDCRFDNVDGVNRCFAGVLGDPCNDFGQRCGPNLVCRRNPVAGVDECQAPIAAGQSCDDDPDLCERTLRCLDDDGDFNFTCEQPVLPNAPCEQFGISVIDPCDATHRCRFDVTEEVCVVRLAAGAVCNEDEDCTTGLRCDEFGSGTCVGLRNENQTCDQQADCAANLECRFDDAGSDTICRSLSAQGEGCQELDDCEAGLDCRVDDTGVRNICRGPSAPDQRCESVADCATNLDCRFNDNGTFEICRGLSADGGTCENDLDCEAELSCRFDNVTFREQCTGPAEAGELCSIDEDCVDGLSCRFDNVAGQSLCRQLAIVGDPCTFDDDCTTGLRCRDVLENGNFVCTDRQDLGGPCAEDADCISGLCNLDGEFCTEPQPEIDFEVCDGLE